MKNLIQQTVELLKLRVKENLDHIKKNQVVIKDILQQPSSEDRTRLFEERYRINKNLLSENNDFINVQLTLINFLDKYKDKDIMGETPAVEIDVHDANEVFNFTVNGEIPYNQAHPFYGDKKFFSRLLKYYEQNEMYEHCQRLLETKNK